LKSRTMHPLLEAHGSARSSATFVALPATELRSSFEARFSTPFTATLDACVRSLRSVRTHPNRLAIACPRQVPLSGFVSRRVSHARRACDRARTRSPFEDHVWARSHAPDAAPATSTRSSFEARASIAIRTCSHAFARDTHERHLDTLLFREWYRGAFVRIRRLRRHLDVLPLRGSRRGAFVRTRCLRRHPGMFPFRGSCRGAFVRIIRCIRTPCLSTIVFRRSDFGSFMRAFRRARTCRLSTNHFRGSYLARTHASCDACARVALTSDSRNDGPSG
jgi:hypothetical protein